MILRARWLRWGHIEGGIAQEEASRLEGEASVLNRHHWPVLWPDDMVGAKGVPHDHIRLLQRSIGLRVRNQARATALLVRVVSGGIAFSGIIGRDPQMAAGKGSSLPLRRAGREEGKHIALRHQCIAGR